MDWKNDNSHSFDVAYLKELMAGLQKQAQARELTSTVKVIQFGNSWTSCR